MMVGAGLKPAPTAPESAQCQRGESPLQGERFPDL
ncbi:hypothetical protein B188_19750 [Candidatus Brocadiaceae bacterium B188]|nr:hypothetical protein B188_19750 [Candidatus Brocadiaceae bacterium B188]